MPSAAGWCSKARRAVSIDETRNKTMGIIDQVLRTALSQGKLSNPLMLALLALLASSALFGGGSREAPPTKPGGRSSEDEGLLEGLGGLLDRFRQSGQGKTIDSWIGTGPNEPVSPGQLGNTLGPNILKTLAERSGMSEDELLKQLSQALPDVVDKLTPRGRLPTLAELAE
jgi:uncharacterized protein YidB (DUF937 family)